MEPPAVAGISWGEPLEPSSAGIYTIQVSARSDYHRIDRMVLCNTTTRTLSDATGRADETLAACATP